MGPKPFPYSIGVGVDICSFTRFYHVLRHDSEKLTRWARRVFACQEWPSLHQKIYQASDQPMRSQNFRPSLWLPQVRSPKQPDNNVAKSYTETKSSFRRLRIRQDEATFEHDTRDLSTARDPILVTDAQSVFKDPLPSTLFVEPRKLQLLAQSLAGRWAAKEAALKAHRHRKLRMSDIAILSPDISRPEDPQGSTGTVKLQALISPEPTLRIVMAPEVAKTRRLREGHSNFSNVHGNIANGRFVQHFLPLGEAAPQTQTVREFIVRRARIREEEQQIAEISISHDGEYSVAVCMALDEPSEEKNVVEYIVDDGVGEPLHQPEWGDQGWLDEDHESGPHV